MLNEATIVIIISTVFLGSFLFILAKIGVKYQLEQEKIRDKDFYAYDMRMKLLFENNLQEHRNLRKLIEECNDIKFVDFILSEVADNQFKPGKETAEQFWSRSMVKVIYRSMYDNAHNGLVS